MSMMNHVEALIKPACNAPHKQLVLLNIEHVRSKKSQVRKSFAGIEELAQSILQEGQIQPIVVSAKNSAGYYIIQKGERRWRACQVAGLSHIEVIINDKLQSDLEEIAGELIENIQRENLAPLEIANALHCFVVEGWPQKKIAQRLGKNSSFVSTHLSLLKMPACVCTLYDNMISHDVETLNNLRLLFDIDEAYCQKVCQAALHNGITRKQSRELVNQAKRRLEQAEPIGNATLPANSMNSAVTPFNADTLGSDTLEESALAAGDDSHEAEAIERSGIVQAVSGNDVNTEEQQAEVDLPTESHPAWRKVTFDQLRIVVNVLGDIGFQRALLLTDRVDMESDYVWVKILCQSQERIARAHVSDIELIGVERQ